MPAFTRGWFVNQMTDKEVEVGSILVECASGRKGGAILIDFDTQR